MIHGRTLHFLLALTFAVGQWFGVVHGTQHELNSADKLVACEVCVAGHAAAGPPSAILLSSTFVPKSEAPATAQVAAPQLQPFYRPPSRGPPLLLV